MAIHPNFGVWPPCCWGFKTAELVLHEDIIFPWVIFIKKYVTYFKCAKYLILFISLLTTFSFILIHHNYNTPYALSYSEGGISPHRYSKLTQPLEQRDTTDRFFYNSDFWHFFYASVLDTVMPNHSHIYILSNVQAHFSEKCGISPRITLFCMLEDIRRTY